MDELARQTTTDVADADLSVAVVPTGSTEQHGPALPLGTDTYAATHFATVAAERDDTVRTPAIPVGVSPHHRHFDGTLWVGEETFRRYVEEVVRSFAADGIRRVVIVNGHGGNTNALERVARRVRADGVAAVVPWSWGAAIEDELADAFEDPGGHACHGETSLLWAIDEAHVRPDRLEAAAAGAPPGWGHTVHGGTLGLDTIDFTPTGAVGDPTAASVAVGEELLAAAEAELRACVDRLADAPLEDLVADAHPLHPGE